MLIGLTSTIACTCRSCFLGYRLANGGCYLVNVGPAVLASDLLDNDQLFLAIRCDGKSGSCPGLQGRVSSLYGQFDIVRVMVASVNDDQVFQTAGNVEVPIL